jgi:hypothetical protein
MPALTKDILLKDDASIQLLWYLRKNMELQICGSRTKCSYCVYWLCWIRILKKGQKYVLRFVNFVLCIQIWDIVANLNALNFTFYWIRNCLMIIIFCEMIIIIVTAVETSNLTRNCLSCFLKYSPTEKYFVINCHILITSIFYDKPNIGKIINTVFKLHVK